MTASELELLKAENEKLRRQLAVATAWMARQWREESHKISKLRTGKMTESVRSDFMRENMEELTYNRIHAYF